MMNNIGNDWYQIHNQQFRSTNGSTRRLNIVSREISLISHQGDLGNEFHLAFTSSSTEHLPLLIQIYINEQLEILHSTVFEEFLQENYVVFPWNISNSVDRETLTEIWREYFPDQPAIDLSTVEQFPMLIGVMTFFPVGNDSSFERAPEILLINNVLVRTNEEFKPEILFDQLILFKKEFEMNVRCHSSRFIQNIVSCSELVFTISEYLSLNDAVTTFSLAVLPFLWKYNRKLPVIHPSKEFLDLMKRYNYLGKTTSLHIEENRFKQLIKSNQFPHTKTLGLTQMDGRGNIRGIDAHFPTITSLFLSYDKNVHFHRLCQLFKIIPPSTRHLTIRCRSIQCLHYSSKYLFVRVNDWNTTVKIFELYISSTDQSTAMECLENRPKCILQTIVQFIEIMSHIESVRIITEGNIETFLDIIEWVNLARRCKQLVQIRVEGKSTHSFDEQLSQTINNELQNIRPTIDFQIQLK